MTKQELEEIKERAARATSGPWKHGYADGSGIDTIVADKPVAVTMWGCSCCKGEVTEENFQDAKFIANARTDIPKLVEALEIAVEALKNAANQVTWVDEKNPKVILTYGFPVESCRKALEKIGWKE